jgi:PIN domain nuclease of toxin-antitoxin system
VRLLLDTHAALWWLADDGRFSEQAARELTRPANQVLLSAVVVWEVAIKRSLGKLEAPADFRTTLLGAGALPLAIDLEHAAGVEKLPRHHRDPFDRLLVVQAMSEGASIVTHDPAFRDYGVPVIW